MRRLPSIGAIVWKGFNPHDIEWAIDQMLTIIYTVIGNGER